MSSGLNPHPCKRSARGRSSVRLLMIVIAVIGLAMFVVRAILSWNTVYSAGYDEGRFRQVRVGMTSEEVEGLMGPPLRKLPWPDQNLMIWMYTAKRSGGGDYWRRHVFMKDGKVVQVISMYTDD